MTKVAISFENTVKLGYNIQLGAGKIRSLKPGFLCLLYMDLGLKNLFIIIQLVVHQLMT